MSELSKQLESMFSREGLQNNQYLLCNLTPNLQIQLSQLQKEESLIQYSSQEIQDALNQCRNCKLHKNYVQVLIQPKNKNIIINDANSINLDFQEQLIEKYLKNIEYEIQVDGYLKIKFKYSDDCLKFLDQAQHTFQVYIEPENIYQTLMQQLTLNNNILQVPSQYHIKQNFKLYFLKGCDNRQLSSSYQKQFLHFTKLDPYSHSFLVYNQYELKEKINKWKQNLTWITPYYAVKSNPIDILLEDIVTGPYGTFDCASKREIKMILKLGVPGSKIVFSNTVKEEKDIFFARENGIQITCADTIDELIKIQKIASDMKILWRLSIVEENPEQMTTIFSGKFGDDLPNLESVHNRFKEIQDIGINIYGIHFHCGSGSSSFNKAIDLARECIKIGREYGHAMQLLDVGGGYPTGTIQDNIWTALKKTKDDPLGYQVIAEPGRHFSANTCYLLFRVMAKRIKQGKLCYHVNDSYYHSFNCLLTDGVTFENQTDQFYGMQSSDSSDQIITQQQNGSIFGMTCDGADVIVNNIKLPSNIEIGDWLCMGGMGSYTIGPKSEFNGMKCTAKVYKWTGRIEEQNN